MWPRKQNGNKLNRRKTLRVDTWKKFFFVKNDLVKRSSKKLTIEYA